MTPEWDTDGVCVCCLADLLTRVLDQQQRDRPVGSTGHNHGFTSHLQSLAKGADVSQRKIFAILNRETTTVGLRIADELLCALDRPDLVFALRVFRRNRGHRFGIPGNHVCHARVGCSGCGCDLDTVTAGCKSCRDRMGSRRERARAAACSPGSQASPRVAQSTPGGGPLFTETDGLADVPAVGRRKAA